MITNILKSKLLYAGLPAIGAAMLIFKAGQTDPFIMLRAMLIVTFGYIAAVNDARTNKIENRLLLVMLTSWIILMMPKFIVDIDGAVALLTDSGLGFAISGGLFMLVYLLSRKGLGGGDVKFMAVTGLYLGFGASLSAMLCGMVLAALACLILILLKKIGRKDSIPLAPFLYAGILITVFLY